MLGRNTRGLVVCANIAILNRFNENPQIKETIWMGIRSNVILHATLIISFVYIRHGTHGCIIRILQNSQMGELK
jgi:hypothetical protein